MTTSTPSALQCQHVSLSHGRTRDIEAGQGDPLILIHGFPFHHSADSWLPNIDGLAAEFRVLAPDCVGWSPSDVLDEAYSFAYLTDFMREFQDALGLPRSHIVGSSMGGGSRACWPTRAPIVATESGRPATTVLAPCQMPA
jgi:pimeloyl-ACP methyl ester carboxylesterase